MNYKGFLVSQQGSDQFFEMMKFKIKTNFEIFNLTELMYILKSYHIRKMCDEELSKMIEQRTAELIRDPKAVLLEELCAVCDGFCNSRKGSRDFHKLLEIVIVARLKDIMSKPNISKYLYNTFHTSGLCSVGLMNELYRSYTG